MPLIFISGIIPAVNNEAGLIGMSTMALFVNGQEISKEEVEAEKERLRSQHDKVFAQMEEKARDRQLCQWCRENVIERVLMVQTAQQRTPDIPEDHIANAYQHLLSQNPAIADADKDGTLAEIKTQLQVENLVQQITSSLPEPTEDQIEKFYNENIEQFTIPQTIHAAHIVFHPSQEITPDEQKKKLTDILADIRNGADFAETAAKVSDCGDDGGDLGYFARGKMVPEFEEVVFNMEVGQISDVFQTEFGFHIARVLDKKPEIPCELKYAREIITKQLQQHAGEEAIAAFLDAQKAKAKITGEL